MRGFWRVLAGHIGYAGLANRDLDFRSLNLANVITGALEMTEPVREKRSRPIDVHLPGDPVYVSGDATRLTQMLSNLLTNALRHTPTNGRVALRVERAGRTAEISVEDSGSGIAAELLPRMFEIFVQGRQRKDRRAGGLGLGLAIVKALVELHGGTVSALSKGVNRGSTFVVRLPIAESTALSDSGPDVEAVDPPVRSGRILVVDDNVDAAETLALLLRCAGYEVRTAGEAETALTLAETFPPEVAVLDIGLPGMDGYELAIKLRAQLRNPDLKLVALTGYGRESDLERALNSGFDVHLVKPANPERLLDEIARLLAKEKGKKVGPAR